MLYSVLFMMRCYKEAVGGAEGWREMAASLRVREMEQ
jgi:hypothetical protein